MIVKKKAADLRVGDKILGQTNYYNVTSVKNSSLTGCMYPVIEVTDSRGIKKMIETGGNEKFQDHVYEVDLPDPEVVPVVEEPVTKVAKKKTAKKVVKKVVKKVAKKKAVVKKATKKKK
jgi:hypothetical protein